MKKTLLSLSLSLAFIGAVNAQAKKDWSEVKSGNDITVAKTAQRQNFPESYSLFKLNFESIKTKLYAAQDRSVSNANFVTIEIPNAKGAMEKFRMYEASNFDAELQQQFPDIRAYVGEGIDDKSAQVRMSISPFGISTMTFRADKPTEYMEVFSADKTTYALYTKDSKSSRIPLTCSTLDEHIATDLMHQANQLNNNRSSDLVLRTFRLAMSVTGEYSTYHGGTLPQVVAAVNTTMTRVNGVFEKDLAIRMNLIANSTNVMYLNAGTDPYGATDANYNSELQSTLTSVIGEANYDVGHLMSAIGNNGNAGCIGCVCTNGQKGSGFTTSTVPVGDNFDIDFVVHELGHQFGANHSFSFSNENNSVNYEPGSGVTIMGYAGITSYDVAPHSIDTFHAGNIAQIQTNMAGKTCETETAITHGAPAVNAGADYTIPFSTPFTLTGSATDTGGGSLTYQWEQYDDAALAAQLTTGSPASPTKVAGPNFRSYLPTASGARTFPNWTSVLALSPTTFGTEIIVEALSSVTRTLNFRLTVRDNAANGGQTNFDDVAITVANKTALTVTVPNNTSYPTGSTQTVTWTGTGGVNGHNTIAGATNVDILLSTDNGATWGYTLATGTPNDGSESVTLPAGVNAVSCRFLVRASANIFFNVSQAFAIGYTITNTCNTYTINPNVAIPDNTTSFLTHGLNVPTTANISDVNLAVNLTHTWIADITVAVLSPGATQVNVFSGACTNNDNINATFDDQGSAIVCATTITGNVIPAQALSAFNGQNPNGTWTFGVVDSAAQDTGTIVSYALTICSQTVTLSTDNFGLENFTIYPNPNNGNFSVQFDSNSGNEIKIGVHDMRGRLVFEKSYQNTGTFNQNLQLNNVQSGVYMVTVQDGERKEVKKISVK
ncbi:reprolysin-like metallopeptidase [Flavobacterium enshiense]|uniref:zinc-dependent metalloprotease n=1 Tax=Flavobacterium enshiense TaxID=1341165 RepID=UPI00345CC0ED